MLVLDNLRIRRESETAGAHVARIVCACDGISLIKRREDLETLFAANETTQRAREVATWKTNCGTFARCVYALAGCDHTRIIEPYVNGRAIDDLQVAGAALGAMLPASEWRSLGPGWGLLYWRTGNDAHFEFCLAAPDVAGMGYTGGAGRINNAITVGHGSVLHSHGRPLQRIFDPARMCANYATHDNPY